MGMDIFGKKPKNKEGEYFRNNVWWWHPLWDYCQEVAPEIINDKNSGHNNDGWGLCDRLSLQLAVKLTSLLESGEVAEYAKIFNDEKSKIPDEKCSTCGGTGKRLPPPKIGPGKIMCNGCNGKGTHKPIGSWYSFEESNVKEFVNFLKNCGGFKIC